MSTGGEMLVSRYRPLFIFAALAPILNYLGHAFFDWKLVSMDFIEYLPTRALPDARLSDSWNSYMAVAQFLLLITGVFVFFALIRQSLSVAGFSKLRRIDNSRVLIIIAAGYVWMCLAGPFNPDMIFFDDPKLRGNLKWFFVFAISVLTGGISGSIVNMVLDPHTFNENSKRSPYLKGD